GPLLHRRALGGGGGRDRRPSQRDRDGRVPGTVHAHLQPHDRRDQLRRGTAGQRGGGGFAAGLRRHALAVLRGDRAAGGREDPLQDLGQRAAARPRALKRGTMMTTLYGLNNCDTCRKARKWLDRFGIAHGFVDYRDDKPGPDTLVEWAGKLGGFEAMVNKSSTTWRQLPDNRKTAGSDAEWKL